jgi:hypothetical protein
LLDKALLTFSATPAGLATPVWQKAVAPDKGLSLAGGGKLAYTAAVNGLEPGVYFLSASLADQEIAREVLHVLEE